MAVDAGDRRQWRGAGRCSSRKPGRHIINPRAIERDLEKTRSELTVRVLVRD
jgi:hypothetical protein